MGLFGYRSSKDRMIEHLLQANTDLLDRLQEMVGQIHYHQVQKAVAPPAPVDVPRERLWSSEEEQDAQHAYDSGLIDKKELERALEEIGFMNSEIDMQY